MNGVASLRDIEAIESEAFPSDLPRNTYELLKRSARAFSLAPALSFFSRAAHHRRPRRWNYRQFLVQVTRAANAFHQLGANKDSVIAVVLPNLPETHFAVWGGQATGISMPINYLLEPDAIVDLLDETAASILVTATHLPELDLWKKLQPLLGRLKNLQHVLLVDAAKPVATQQSIKLRDVLPSDSFQVHDYASCLRLQRGHKLLSDRRIDPEDYSSLLCTGGTTGAPKVALRRHRNEVANAWSAARCFGDSIGPGKNFFCGLPLFHANGLLVTGLLPFARGAHVVLGTPLGYRGAGVIENFWSIVDHHQIHFFSAVPTIFGALLRVPREKNQLDSLEYGLCGAAPMPRELINRFEQETRIRVLEGYGLTEATCVSSLNPPKGERRAGSIGLRLPGQAMKVVHLSANGDFERDALDDEVGMLIISGPNVFAGYWREEQNHGTWLEPGNGRRWLITGDLGYRDAQSYFWLTGRAKDLIIRGGHNIDPAAIEEPLYSHPGVQLVAAVGRPDHHAGELPIAYVQAKSGHPVTADELQMYLEQNIRERAAMPKAIVMIDTMPLTAIGKINKAELRRRETEYALRHALLDAGVPLRSVSVAADGIASVALADDLWRPTAEDVVERFPLRCRFMEFSASTANDD